MTRSRFNFQRLYTAQLLNEYFVYFGDSVKKLGNPRNLSGRISWKSLKSKLLPTVKRKCRTSATLRCEFCNFVANMCFDMHALIR